MDEIEMKTNRGIEIDIAGTIQHPTEKILKDSGGKVAGKIKNIAGTMEVGEEKMVVNTMTMEEVNGETEFGEGIMVAQEERKEIGIEEGRGNGQSRGQLGGSELICDKSVQQLFQFPNVIK